MSDAPESAHEIRLKRLRMRCWHRGTKEMDLILGQFADGPMAQLDADDLDALETLMDENDNDLYLWVSGAQSYPDQHTAIITRLRDFHQIG